MYACQWAELDHIKLQNLGKWHLCLNELLHVHVHVNLGQTHIHVVHVYTCIYMFTISIFWPSHVMTQIVKQTRSATYINYTKKFPASSMTITTIVLTIYMIEDNSLLANKPHVHHVHDK